MKAWQLTLGLAVVAVAAGRLPQIHVFDRAPPVRARLEDGFDGFVRTRGPEEPRAHVEAVTLLPVQVQDSRSALGYEKQGRAIDRLLRNDPRIRACLGPPSGVPGSQVVVQMQVLPDGSVSDVHVTDPATLVCTELAGCLSSTIGSMTFPKPADGSSVSVTYPFEL